MLVTFVWVLDGGVCVYPVLLLFFCSSARFSLRALIANNVNFNAIYVNAIVWLHYCVKCVLTTAFFDLLGFQRRGRYFCRYGHTRAAVVRGDGCQERRGERWQGLYLPRYGHARPTYLVLLCTRTTDSKLLVYKKYFEVCMYTL